MRDVRLAVAWLPIATALAFASFGCGTGNGSSVNGGDAGATTLRDSGADATALVEAGGDATTPYEGDAGGDGVASAETGPSCTYPMYSESDYEGFADSGVYPNLPCGGCAPAKSVCSGGQAYACWAGSGYSAPPYPAQGCLTAGVTIESNEPAVWDVCCRGSGSGSSSSDSGASSWSCSQGLCMRNNPVAACYALDAPGWTCRPDALAEAGACSTNQFPYTCTSPADGGPTIPAPCSAGAAALCCMGMCPPPDAGGPPADAGL